MSERICEHSPHGPDLPKPSEDPREKTDRTEKKIRYSEFVIYFQHLCVGTEEQ